MLFRSAYNQRGGKRNRTRRRQKGGGGVDETLFETLYTLYVYRAQWDIELNTHDQSINMSVLEELYKDYPISTSPSNRRVTLKNITGNQVNMRSRVTGVPKLSYYVTGNQVTGSPSVNMRKLVPSKLVTGKLVTGKPFMTHKQPRMVYGGRITRRKKRNHRIRK